MYPMWEENDNVCRWIYKSGWHTLVLKVQNKTLLLLAAY